MVNRVSTLDHCTQIDGFRGGDRILLKDFDYELPEELIAQTPLEDRAASRLLHLDQTSGAVSHHAFRDVMQFLREDDTLVINNTRVTALRLLGHKKTGGAVEALLLRETSNLGEFICLVKPAKSLRIGVSVDFGSGLSAVVTAIHEDGLRALHFESEDSLREALTRVGSVPLPPYIHAKLDDAERYQTVYAAQGGSSAAPTAGLHFTEEIISQVQNHGVKIARVTLDVGIDTFRPVAVENLDDHVMHGETCRIDEVNAEIINRTKGRIIAVGTTSVRTLESFAVGHRQVNSGEKNTQIFIRPGHQWQMVDGMFTNFHLPKTTMLMMLAALVGREPLMAAYAEAVAHKYRFLSFGDSMLIL